MSGMLNDLCQELVSAVYDGYLLKKSVRWSPVGGRLLTECMQKSIDADGTVLRPRYEIRKTHLGQGNFSVRKSSEQRLIPGVTHVQISSLNFPNTTASYRQFCVEAIAADAKESICRVSDFAFSEGDNSNMPTVTYEVHVVCLAGSVRMSLALLCSCQMEMRFTSAQRGSKSRRRSSIQ